MFGLFGGSRVGDLAQTPEQSRQHLTHDQHQPAYRLGACVALLFRALEARCAVGRRGGRVWDQPGFTLLAAQVLLLAFFFSPAL